MKPLPIDRVLTELCDAVERAGAAVLVAETGAGKTTRVPPALLDRVAGRSAGDVLVVEPRRIAARLAAERVAAERGERAGESVGYAVRFEERRGPKTRLCFMTSGILLRRLMGDPTLQGVAAVVFDELHERHLVDDVLLAWLQHVRTTSRADLKLVAMSATLDPAPVARFLGAEVIHSTGRAFPVAIEYARREDERALEVRVSATLARAGSGGGGLDGDVLVFLPGVASIRRCARATQRVAAEHGLHVVQLHGGLTPAETRAALAPAPNGRRKVLLATNVAESSITLPGVTCVIDSGRHNVARSSPWTGLSSLTEEDVPRASADQRAGRAGRTAPGRCVRLYTEASYRRRPAESSPEIQRVDLAPYVLSLARLGVAEAAELGWLTPPEPARWQAARSLLGDLGALGDDDALTAEGRALARLPLHPRLGRLLRAADERGAARSGAAAAALLSEGVRLPDGLADSPSDVLALVRCFNDRRLPAPVGRRVAAVVKQLRPKPDRQGNTDSALLQSVLAGFPDRVGRCRSDRGDVMLVGGGTARLAHRSTVRHEPWICCVDAGGAGRPLVRLASAIEPDWLLELPGAEADLTEGTEVRWDKERERVAATATLRWRGLVLEESAVEARGRPETTELLRQRARAAGLARFGDAKIIATLAARRRFAHGVDPDIASLEPEDVLSTLDQLCDGVESFKELRQADLLATLKSQLSWKQTQRLDALAPERVPLPGGGHARVDYSGEGLPRVRVRVQRLLGSRDGPLLGAGRVRPLLELLAPNGRAVQLTDDLPGFWDRTWPAVRRELRGRYPKHAWPEDPMDRPPPRRRGR